MPERAALAPTTIIMGYNEAIAFVDDDYNVPDGVQIINNIVNYEGGHNSIMVDGDMGGRARAR